MTLTLSLAPEVEARLRERAAAAGKDVATIVREAVEEKLASDSEPTSAPAALPDPRTPEQWEAEFRAWVASHKPVGHFVDDSRESIYAGRGE